MHLKDPTLSMNLRFSAAVLIFFATACTSDKPTQEYLAAFDTHEELLTIETETRSIFESIEQVLARDTSLSSFSAELQSLKDQLNTWEEKVIAVGGNAEHEGHLHDHNHLNSSQISDEELLTLQKSLHAEIDSLSSEVSALVERMMDR